MNKYRERTFSICMSYLETPNCKTKRAFVRCLTKWSKSTYKLEDYGYQRYIDNEDVIEYHISYCSDRMNKGRALAILRMLKEK